MTTVPERSWKTPECKQKMRDWVAAMDEQTFCKGSVIEIFEYVNCLLMINGPRDNNDKVWWTMAIDDTTDWLEKIVYVCLLDKSETTLTVQGQVCKE
jgi:hypothetical protein